VAVEARYLGAVFVRPEALEQAPVQVADLVSPPHQAILSAMLAVRGRAEDVNTVSVRIELERQGRMRSVGIDRLMALQDTLELDPHACAKRIRELSEQRRIREASLKAVSLVEAGDAGEARRELARVALEEPGADDDPVLTFREMLTATAEALAETARGKRFVTLGTPSVDAVFRAGPGDLVVVGAATNVGKSTQLMTWAMSLARRGVPCGIISIEDGAEDYGSKGLTAISGVASELMWNGAAGPQEYDRMMRGVDAEGHLPLCFSRIKSRSVEGVVSRMAYMVRVRGARVVMVDYLQAIRHRDVGSSMRERVNDTLHALMAAAAQLDVVLVLASQLRRAEGSKHHEPHDGELKESGDIENSAQCIVLLWRETDDESDPRYGIVYGKVAKVKRAAAGRRYWMQRSQADGLLVERQGKPPQDVHAGNPYAPRRQTR
jgi:replicative DNA helicase